MSHQVSWKLCSFDVRRVFRLCSFNVGCLLLKIIFLWVNVLLGQAVATIETKSYEKLVQDLENTPSLKIMKRPLRYFGMTLLLFSGTIFFFEIELLHKWSSTLNCLVVFFKNFHWWKSTYLFVVLRIEKLSPTQLMNMKIHFNMQNTCKKNNEWLLITIEISKIKGLRIWDRE